MNHRAAADASAAREARWRRQWQSRRWPAWAWWPLAQFYGALVRLRRLAYRLGWLRSTRVGRPVLVIGNVLAGGAGKTPTTIALVQHLQARGVRVGVISRGHGREATAETVRLVSARSEASQVGDEPLLIHRRTGVPVAVARRRADAAQALLLADPQLQLLIADDGLQHLALARDLSLCVFDERGLGNGWLLPAGPLREPWPRPVDWTLQIHAADAALPPEAAVAGAHLAQRVLADHAVDGWGQSTPLTQLRDLPVVAFAGIAKPEAFFAALRGQGLQLRDAIALADHASPLTHPALRALFEGRTPPGLRLLCTEKDAVKVWARHPQVLAVPLRLMLPAHLLEQIDRRIDALLQLPPAP